jgi:hypothetical protein
MGACLTQFRQVAEVLAIEANAVSDNPLVFAAEGDVINQAQRSRKDQKIAACGSSYGDRVMRRSCRRLRFSGVSLPFWK